MTLYQVTTKSEDRSPWELVANSPEHAIATIWKFYPEVNNVDLIAHEVTFNGERVTLLNRTKYGDKFKRVLEMNSGRSVQINCEWVRGDFDPTRNKYRCVDVSGNICYFDPYTKITKE